MNYRHGGDDRSLFTSGCSFVFVLQSSLHISPPDASTLSFPAWQKSFNDPAFMDISSLVAAMTYHKKDLPGRSGDSLSEVTNSNHRYLLLRVP